VNKQSGYQVSGTGAEMYEHYATRYMEALTLDLLDLAALRPGERVLDVACGTGQVARYAASRVGQTGKVTGLDINEGMLTVARATPTDSGAGIRWIAGSAMAMDLPAASFDVVLCQQGLQFFPDRHAALREIHRVLAPDGRALLSVWAMPSPYNVAVGKAFETCVGIDTATRYRALRASSPDAEALQSMMLECGFQAVQVRPRTVSLHLPFTDSFILGHLSSGPMASVLSALSEERRAQFVAQVKTLLQVHAAGDHMAIPESVDVAIGCKTQSERAKLD